MFDNNSTLITVAKAKVTNSCVYMVTMGLHRLFGGMGIGGNGGLGAKSSVVPLFGRVRRRNSRYK